MIVTCEQCSTQFQLDDTKVPERGVKVRCSRCKHAFFVKRVADAGDPVNRAVQDALDHETAPGGQARAERSGPLDEGVEESDWEFNHEPADELPGPDGDADPLDDETHPLDGQREPHVGPDLTDDALPDVASDAVDDLLAVSDPGALTDFGSDPVEGGESLIGGADADLSLGRLGPEPGQGTGLDLSGAPNPLHGDPSESDPFMTTDEPVGGTDPGPLDEDVGLEEPPAQSLTAAPEAPAAQAAGEDGLGSPEDWNFFDDGDAPEPAPSAGRISIGRIGVVGGGAVRRPPAQVDAEPSRLAVWLERGVNAVGWMAVSVLTAAGLYGGLGFAAGGAPRAAAPVKQAVAGLEVASVSGSWIENAAGGPLYVISGELRNPGRQSVTPDARLAVRLLDERGMPVQAQAAAGRRLPVERLRLDPPAELRTLLEQQSDAMARAPLGPASSRRFHAVFGAVPDTAARFELVALEAKPLPPAAR